jgi:hypothetical protein
LSDWWAYHSKQQAGVFVEVENFLLIGGPKDGEWMTVLAGVSELRMAWAPSTQSPDKFSFETVIYRRHVMQSLRGLNAVVYACDDNDGYRPSARPEDA